MTDNDNNDVYAITENMAHVFVFDPIYDGRCMFCDCRAYGVHSSSPCPR